LYGAPASVEVIGVAANIRLRDVLAAPPPVIYVPFSQGKGPVVRLTTWTLRGALPPAVLAKQVRPIVDKTDATSAPTVRTVQDAIGQSLLLNQVTAWLTGLFGLLGLGLAIAGTYGVVSLQMQRRIPELGLRLALGATPRGLAGTLCAAAMRPVAVGVAAGSIIAVIVIWALASYFQALTTSLPMSLSWSVLALTATTTLACLIPVIRVLRGNPLAALRNE